MTDSRSVRAWLPTQVLLLILIGCQAINVDTEVVDPPTILPLSGVYGSDQDVIIDHVDPGVDLFYTLGDPDSPPPDPTEASTEYTGPFTVPYGATVVKAIATKPGLRDSLVASRTIRVVWRKVSTEDLFSDSDEFSYQAQAAVGLYNDSIVVYGTHDGGTDRLFSSFDPDTGTWSGLTPEPAVRDGGQFLRHGDHLYLVGGCEDFLAGTLVPKPTSERFDGSSWTSAGNITERYRLGAVSSGMNIFALGGVAFSGADPGVDIAEMYTAHTGTQAWEGKAGLPLDLSYFSTAHVSGHIYVFGGYDDAEDKQDSILDYSIAGNSWTESSATLPRPVVGTSAVPWDDPSLGRTLILVFGNHVAEGNPALDPQKGEPLFFDPLTAGVRIGTALDEGDARNSAAVNLDGRVFLICQSGDVWEYDPALDY
jgi:hypothetical protein